MTDSPGLGLAAFFKQGGRTMLCFGRGREEKVYLILPTEPAELLALAGQRITVTTLERRRQYCRLGFEAPKSINIARDDVKEPKGGS